MNEQLFNQKAGQIKFFLTDVDGVMTDSSLSFFTDEAGKTHEIKHFDVETQHKYKIKVQRIEPIEQNKRHSYNIHLYIDDDLYDICKLSTNRLFITTLGPYFGGNTKAPHKMKIRKY